MKVDYRMPYWRHHKSKMAVGR